MAFDIQAAKQAGYTDEEINAYLQAKPETKTIAPVAPGQEVDPGEPPPPPSPEGFKQAGEGNYLPAIGTAAAAAAPYAVPAVATGAGLYGAAKVGGWGRDILNTAREGMEAYKTGVGQNAATQEFRALERMARGTGPDADMARQRLQQLIRAQSGLPTGSPPPQAGQQAFSQMGQQLSQTRPVNPASMPMTNAPAPAPQQPSIMQRGMDMANRVRQMAAQRIVPAGAGAMAGPAAVMGGVAAVPGAMMVDAYRNYQTQTPEQRKRSAMEALSGQGLGQAGIY